MKNYNGDFTIPVSRNLVWDFLVDPNQVGNCLPDLLQLDVIDPHHFNAKVRVGIGPIRGAFSLSNSLTVTEPGVSANMTAKGGGMGSGVSISAQMILEDLEDQKGTILKWTSDVVVNGPIATIGGRLIDGQARKVTEKVFENIRTAVIALSEELNAKMDQAQEEVATAFNEKESDLEQGDQQQNDLQPNDLQLKDSQ